MRARFLLLALTPVLILGCDGDKGTTVDTGPDTGDVSGDVPDIAVNVATLDFGSITPGSNELEQMTIENLGTGPLTITSFTFEPDWGWVTAQLPTPLQVSDIAPVVLNFSCKPDLATSGGVSNLSGVVRIASDDPDEAEVIVGIDCEMLTDADGDGFEGTDIGGDDCDDNDPTIYPDAPDEWYDGIDSNCDEADDYDQDKDGFRSVIFDENLSLPSGSSLYHPTKNPNGYHLGGDCQDNNPDIYPDYLDFNLDDLETGVPPRATPNINEVWYDGIDHNCDNANDYDADGDGYSAESAGRGSDCDDNDPDTNPDTIEMLNGIDDDCDETIDQDVPGFNSDLAVEGSDAGHQFGYAVVMGDLNDDGYDDIVASAPGYGDHGLIAVFDGDDMPEDTGKGILLTDAKNFFEGLDGEGLGATVAFYDDARGNGNPDIAIGGASYSGSYTNGGIVYVLPGGDALLGGDLSDAFLTIEGDAASQQVGAGIASQAEFNGDGVNDFVGRYTSAGDHAIWLEYGGATGTETISDVSATFTAGGSKEFAKRNFSPTGDLNGDGYGDMVFCDPGINSAGRLWILWGSADRYEGAGSLATDGTVLFSGNNYEQLGKTCGIGPDWDGDGDAELWVHVIDASDVYSGIYMIPGSEDLEDGGQRPEDIYSHHYETRGSDPGSLNFGHAGDWDNDGVSDVVFGLDKSGVSYGRVWIFGSDDAAGDYTASSDAYASVEGDDDAYQEVYGSAISPTPGDLNNDGYPDFVAGDAGYDAAYSALADAGAIYIHYQVE